jgi:hypothetical protein
MENRASVRVKVSLSCSLERGGGTVFSGQTRNLSSKGAEMKCNGFITPERRPLRPRDVGVFTLSFRKGANLDVIKVGARVVWVTATLARLDLFINQLVQPQRENFSKILDSGQGRID